MKDSKVIDICIEGMDSENNRIRLQSLRTLSSFAQGGLNILEVLFNKGLMSLLVDKLVESKDEVRRWIFYCIYVLLVKNFDRYKELLKLDQFIQCTEDAVIEDWSNWRYNVADRLKQLIII
jgi:hypothetical protein